MSLKAEFYLINYEDQAHAQTQGRKEREFRIIKVKAMTPTEHGGITDQDSRVMDFEGFKHWFQTMNLRGIG